MSGGYDGAFDRLDEAECLQLLDTAHVGRIGLHHQGRILVIPVTFSLQGRRAWFRTAPGTVLASLAEGAEVAFEADMIDDEVANGWSVLARGQAAAAPDHDGAAPSPWAPGVRMLTIAVDLTEFSGRAVSSADNPVGSL